MNARRILDRSIAVVLAILLFAVTEATWAWSPPPDSENWIDASVAILGWSPGYNTTHATVALQKAIDYGMTYGKNISLLERSVVGWSHGEPPLPFEAANRQKRLSFRGQGCGIRLQGQCRWLPDREDSLVR
jgi:hypothetical protein